MVDIHNYKHRLERTLEHIKEAKPSEISKNKIPIKEGKKITNKDYSGLGGGINLLIDEGYLELPKSVDEIWNELKKQVYHYPKSSVSKLLSINFTKNQKILNRVKENKIWKYVIRK